MHATCLSSNIHNTQLRQIGSVGSTQDFLRPIYNTYIHLGQQLIPRLHLIISVLERLVFADLS